MEEIMKKVEDFSDDEEILGAYDAEWHKQQIEESIIQTRLDEEQERLEKAEAETTEAPVKDFSKIETILHSGWETIYNNLDDAYKRARN